MVSPYVHLRQIGTPTGNPQTGGQLLYVKSDGYAYTKDASGTEVKIGRAADITSAVTAHAALTTTHGVSGSLVGTTDTQALTNKTLSTGTKVGTATTDISGAWTSYTPTVTAGSGTFTTVSAAMRYMQIGKTILWACLIGITTVGTAAGAVIFTLPVVASATPWSAMHIGSGRENATTGKSLQVVRGTTSASVLNYDNTSAIAAGASLLLSGSYEPA